MVLDWLEKVVAGGPALIFAIMWWLERVERKQEREDSRTMLKDVITAMLKTESTLETLSNIFNNTKGRS